MSNTMIAPVRFEDKISPVVEIASRCIVDDDARFESASEYIRGIKALRQEVEETFGKIKKKAHDTWKTTVAEEKRYLDPLEIAEKTIREKMAKYLDHLEAERKKEEERRAELARKEREKVLQKVNKRLSVLREKQLSIQEQILALQGDLENPDISTEEAEIIRAQIDTLIARQENTSSIVLDQQVKVEETCSPEPVMFENAPKVAGVSQRVEKIPEVRNPMALIRAIADGKVPDSVVKFDMAVLKKLVNAGMTIPGVAVVSKRTIGVRS